MCSQKAPAGVVGRGTFEYAASRGGRTTEPAPKCRPSNDQNMSYGCGVAASRQPRSTRKLVITVLSRFGRIWGAFWTSTLLKSLGGRQVSAAAGTVSLNQCVCRDCHSESCPRSGDLLKDLTLKPLGKFRPLL